ncbi:WxL domain-containing protein [Carnobacterium maltaromaticum]|uniref:WxL domain-containing protein n=1 Tax=Carnobacterium maltaromaticum TaxID=2751 RepID=UPI0012FB95F5|nr:WxL domain-containing protein [Carnobacterium maltaromaticum]
MSDRKLIKKICVLFALANLGVPNVVVFGAEEVLYKSTGKLEFIPGTDPTNPVDPENPDPTNPVKPIDPTDPQGPNPGTTGPLSIDYASSLDFGRNKITNKDKIYYANAQGFSDRLSGDFRGNYAQITDNRGTNGGWTLKLKQEEQFKSDTATKYRELTGAEISLTEVIAASKSNVSAFPTVNNVTLNPGYEVTIMRASKGNGSGTWVSRFGKAEKMTIDGEIVQKNKAVTLDVPGNTPKEAVTYVTKLIWTLTDTPV